MAKRLFLDENELVVEGGPPAEIRIRNNFLLNGKVLRGFGGFEFEDVAFAAAEMASTAAMNTANGFPRLTFPDAATTSAHVLFNCPDWYAACDIHFGWVNDHNATGNVRWQAEMREVDIGGTIAAGEAIHGPTAFTEASPNPGGLGLAQPAVRIPFNPGLFGSVYTCTITRLGTDAADTLAGPVGLFAVGFTRVD